MRGQTRLEKKIVEVNKCSQNMRAVQLVSILRPDLLRFFLRPVLLVIASLRVQDAHSHSILFFADPVPSIASNASVDKERSLVLQLSQKSTTLIS